MILCLKSIRFLTKHRLCTSTDHQSQVSTLLLNKSKRVDLVVLKQLWKSNTLNTFLEITIGKKPQMSPEKVPTFKLGQKFLSKFFDPITKAYVPNWGKIFVKIFATSKPSWNILNWGKNFCQNFCNFKVQLGHSKPGQNFCQNFCHLKAQMEHPKLGQNFCQNFCNPITRAYIPDWGKIFVKIFATSGLNRTIQTGAIFEG